MSAGPSGGLDGAVKGFMTAQDKAIFASTWLKWLPNNEITLNSVKSETDELAVLTFQASHYDDVLPLLPKFQGYKSHVWLGDGSLQVCFGQR